MNKKTTVPSKKLIQITFVVLILNILLSLITALVNYIIDNNLYLNKSQLVLSAFTTACVYFIWFKFFEFINNEQAKKSTLIVGGCIILMSLFKAFDLYSNKMIVIIISVFFMISYVFWVISILKHKHKSAAYLHTKNYIYASFVLIFIQLIIQIISTTSSAEEYLEERVLFSSIINQIPWIFYFLFLKELPNEDMKKIQPYQEDQLLDADM